MKKAIALLLIFSVISVLFSGCGIGSIGGGDDGLRIVCTLFPQYDFVRSIVDDNATVIMLLPAGTESHNFEPTPTDIIELKNADLFIYIGEEMETWIDPVLAEIDKKTTVLNISDSLGMKLEGHSHEEHAETEEASSNRFSDFLGVDGVDNIHETESTSDSNTTTDANADTTADTTAADTTTTQEHHHDDDEGREIADGKTYDPHIWTDPTVAVRMTELIRDTIISLDPSHSSEYMSNADDYLLELWALDEGIRNVVSSAERREIIFGSRFALRNFTDEYGLTYLAAFDSCTEETEPSAAAVARIVDEIEKKNIPVVFYEELVEPSVAQSLAKETGVTPLLFHSCHNLSGEDFKNGETYVSLMRHNIENLEMALG